ncbi:MAG: hypothetical protein QW292_03915 [Candidatus Parvarchaeota archaeon]
MGFTRRQRQSGSTPPSEDVDISFKLKKRFGKPILFVPGFSIWHKVSARKLSLAFIVQRSYSTGYQRRAIKNQWSKVGEAGDKPLSLEMSLVPRMLTLLLKSVVNLPKSPKRSANIIAVTAVSLIFTVLGYLDFRAY